MRATKGVLRPLLIAASILSFAAAAGAKDGRDFMAYYDVSNVAAAGSSVTLTLQLRLFNYGKNDIQQGAVALYNSEPSPAALGGFPATKLLRAHHDAELAQQFTISRREFDRWQRGASPALFFLHKDAKGQVVRSHIDLVRRPLAPVQSGQ